MKKLLSILMLLVAIVTGAQGADVTFNTNNNSTTPKWTGTTSTSETGTIGDLTVSFNKGTSGSAISMNSNYIQTTQGMTVVITPSSGSFTKVIFNFSAEGYAPDKKDDWAKRFKVDAGTLSKISNTQYQWTGNATSAVTFSHVNEDSGTAISFRFTSIVVTTGSSGKTATTTTITSDSKESLDLAINHGTSAGTLAATVVDAESTAVEGATVSWESSNPSVATINASTGAVTLVATGTTTLKATYAGNDDYEASNDTYQITVTDTRTNLTGAWSANPTFDKDEDTPTIPTFEVTGGTKGTDYTVAYAVVSDENNILTVDANDGITVINTNNVGTATVKATVTVVNTTDYKATTTEYTCTVKVNNVLEAVSDYTWDFTDANVFTDAAAGDYTYNAETYVNNVMIGNGVQLMKKSGDAVNKIQRLKLNQQGAASGYYVKIKVAAHSKVTVSAVGGSSRKINFAENAVGGTKLAEYSCTESSPTDKVLEDSGDGEKVICIYNSASGNITLYSITVEPVAKEITLSDTEGKTKGFATFCSAKNFTVSGASAYKASINSNKIVLTPLGNEETVIPAEAGIIIAGDKGATATVTYTTDDATAEMSGNSLKGTTARVATSTLKNSPTDKVVGFFKSSSAFKSYTGENFPANLAYFLLTAENAVQSFDIVFDGETAINSIDANENANSAAPVKVIKNGKLYIGNYNVAGQLVK